MTDSTDHYLPEWAREPFAQFASDVESLDLMHRLCISGITALQAMPGVVRCLINTPDDSPEDNDKRLRDAARTAELAKKECQTDFPLLRALSAIALWAFLESNLRAFLAGCIQHELPPTSSILKKIKVSVAEWEPLSQADKTEFLLERIEQEVSASLKPGIGRFEAVLEHCGLSGGVPDELRRDILELSEIRNVVLHRNAIADDRFVSRAPWLDYRLGQAVTISEPMLQRYFRATYRYMVLVLCRIASRHGVDVSDINVMGEIDTNGLKSACGQDRPPSSM